MARPDCKDNSAWGRSPFLFQLGRDFKTFAEQISYLLNSNNADMLSEAGNEKKRDWYNQKLFTTESQALGTFDEMILKDIPEAYMQPNQGSTALGGNDSINCYWQFTQDDDIIHPLTQLGGLSSEGLGRVYSETYDKHQQLLHLSMGVPRFTNLKSFYSTMFSEDLVQMNNDAALPEVIARMMGRVVGTAAKVAAGVMLSFAFPVFPFLYLAHVVGEAIDTHNVGKYYDFKSTMPLYYEYVNSIISHLAVNMGLFPDGPGGSTGGTQRTITYDSLFKEGDEENLKGVPEFLRNGPNIYKILAQKEKRTNAQSAVANADSKDYVGKPDSEDGLFAGFIPRLKASMFGGDKFISFRVDKSTDSSESVSNTTGESSIAQQINSISSSKKDLLFSFAGGNIIAGADAAIDTMAAALNGILQGFGVVSTAKNIFTGNGFADIPEVWQGSQFSKSYSFNMTLRSPYGDPVSIMQSIYIPLACLLAAALPRAVGNHAYTSPFLVRAYCKGMFAIPLGIIDSISVKRGASEFGWSTSQLPTVVDVSFTIKDLSPVMHMAIASSGIDELMSVFSQNSSFQEYLLTLSGLGLNERLLMMHNVKRKIYTCLRMWRTTTFNPLYWATSIGQTSIMRTVSAITPWSEYGNN